MTIIRKKQQYKQQITRKIDQKINGNEPFTPSPSKKGKKIFLFEAITERFDRQPTLRIKLLLSDNLTNPLVAL